MAILDHQRVGWVGIKSQKHDDVILEWSLSALYLLMIPNQYQCNNENLFILEDSAEIFLKFGSFFGKI